VTSLRISDFGRGNLLPPTFQARLGGRKPAIRKMAAGGKEEPDELDLLLAEGKEQSSVPLALLLSLGCIHQLMHELSVSCRAYSKVPLSRALSSTMRVTLTSAGGTTGSRRR
jgi:hypothetical protein